MDVKGVSLIILFCNLMTEVLLLCNTAEEGRPLVLTSNITRQEKTIVFILNNMTMLTCRKCTTCLATFPNHSFSNVTSLSNGSCVYTFTYLNVTRRIAAKWIVKEIEFHGNILYTCDLQIHARPKDVICDVDCSLPDLTVMCSASRMYPMGICHYSLTLDGKSTTSNLSSSNSSSECGGSPPDCQTNCSLNIFINNMTNGQYKLLVTVYPNVTGFLGELNFGTSWKHIFNVDENYNDTLPSNCSLNKKMENCSCRAITKSENMSLCVSHTNVTCFNETNFRNSKPWYSLVLPIPCSCGPLVMLSVILCWKRNGIVHCFNKEKILIKKSHTKEVVIINDVYNMQWIMNDSPGSANYTTLSDESSVSDDDSQVWL